MRHPDRVTGLRCTRCDRPACPDCLREAAVGSQCVDCVDQGRRTVRRARTVAGAESADRRPVVTWALIALNVAMFLLTAVQAGSLGQNQFSPVFYDLVLWPVRVVVLDEWWRMLGSGFLHYGPAHLALNMLALYVLGRQLEPVFGKLRFAAVYLLSLLGGSVAVYLFGALDSGVAGASGAVYGLMGALLVGALGRRITAAGPVVGVIGLNLVLSFTLTNISLLGHLGGLAIGAAVTAGLLFAPARNRNAYQAAAVVGAFLLLVALALVRTAQLV
ncbi:rhomboid family intramembrane serine protease [Saccharothrix syringae]|uniref:rhomboid family intramembrane serine protease n=1 Tax=Saccharothrix syringae TaxID=103733 RepID=UPI000AD01A36|nr:rhomboid family intramembrane serine protease [Saccharothrix syringae]